MTQGTKYTPYQRELFEALWYAGIPASIMANEFGIDQTTVSWNAKRFGLGMRGKGTWWFRKSSTHDTRPLHEIINAIKKEVRAKHNPWKRP